MVRLLWLGAALASLASLGHCALFAPQSPVLKLTTSNFDKEVLKVDKPTMVAFTAPWCGHCKNLAPQYQRVAMELDGVVKITYVDCDDTKGQPICARYGVRGFPTLKLFPSTKKRLPRDYNGERTAQAITDYVISTLPAESVRRLDPGKLGAFLEKNADAPKVLLVSPKSKSSPMYRSLALDFRNRVPFGYLYATKDTAFKAVNEALGVTLDIHHVPALYVVTGAPGKPTLRKYRGSMRYRYIKLWLDEVINGQVPPEHPDPPKHKKPSGGAASRHVDPKQFRRAGMSEEEVDAAVRLGEMVGGPHDPEAEEESMRKAAEERKAAKQKLEAIRRASAKLKEKGEPVQPQDPMTGEMLMDKLQDLVGDKWGSSLAARAIEAREVAEKILRESPAKALQATEEAEQFMLKGISNDLRAIEDQINAGVDEEGYPLTQDMEKTMADHHGMLTGMVHTLQLRIDARKNKEREPDLAEEILAKYDL